jgi:hypothetical protein
MVANIAIKLLDKVFSRTSLATRGEVEELKLLAGRQLSLMVRQLGNVSSLQEAEFKVFSQFGDDGIIQYLVHRVDISRKAFIEFGVEDYRESNTRFLLQNDNWSGLVMDGSAAHVEAIRQSRYFWKHDLAAQAAFVTRENINSLISPVFSGEIGLLHIDIDGNDYWVWEALEAVQPDIVIMEYNSLLGHERPLTIPYQPDFVRGKAHYSHLYAGASIAALTRLAEKKGYSLVGSNSAGNNAYFVLRHKLGPLSALQPAEAYVRSKFREARGENGALTFETFAERQKILTGMTFYNVEKEALEEF